MTTNDSPLLTALPPTTDYISYLTIVEQYLTKENLLILQQVLQDATLTINIGWDLVHLLLPLLPESRECLYTIAQLGNPREVILKVTESLRLIDYEPSALEHDESTATHVDDGSAISAPLVLEQFMTLLSMLVTLHARIKTEYPSRFLSTTLQAILASFSQSMMYREQMVAEIVQTINKINGVRRPPLPSRASSGRLSRLTSTSEPSQSAEDPEAAATGVTPEETSLQLKLFQSFLTHVLEEYLTVMVPADGLSHMAWASRVLEQLHPERVIPHSKTMSSRFAEDEVLSHRVDTVGQLASLSQDLRVADEALLSAITTAQSEEAETEDEEEPPSTAADVPLSSIGSLLLYTTKQVSACLYGKPTNNSKSFDIFPDHDSITRVVLAGDQGATLGSEPAAIIDGCLALGMLALAEDRIGTPESDSQFEEYLQRMALLASNCPDSSLRGHAHYLVSTVLRSHPDDAVRYNFIRDTLESSPADNLKPIAVGWLKGEVVEAVLQPATSGGSQSESSSAVRAELDSFAPLLFPSLKAHLLEADLLDAWTTYQANLSFYLASLNFLYLLVYSQQLYTALVIQDFLTEHNINENFIQSLASAKQRFLRAIDMNESGIMDDTDEKGRESLKAELNVLSQALDRYREALKC